MIDKEFLEWIKSSFNKVYACQKNLGFPVYKLKAGHHKRIRIDILAQNKKGIWVAIEFEDGDTFGNITKGIAQLEDFYRMIQNEEVEIITTDNLKIKPKYFLLATQYSKQGYIYKNDRRVINCGGYSFQENLHQIDWTIFCLNRMMWRFCGRTPYSSTNPVGCSYFGIIEKGYNGKPNVELNGKTHYFLDNLNNIKKEDDTKTITEP